MVSDALFKSDKMDWETPDDLFSFLDQEFHFELDACATKENTKCKIFFDEEQDGLKKNWGAFETVWVNPPYGTALKKWIRKGYQQARWEDITVVMLIPSRTDTKYWHDFVMKADEIRFIKGRVRFKGATNSAPFPSAVVVFKGMFDSVTPKISTFDIKKI